MLRLRNPHNLLHNNGTFIQPKSSASMVPQDRPTSSSSTRYILLFSTFCKEKPMSDPINCCCFLFLNIFSVESNGRYLVPILQSASIFIIITLCNLNILSSSTQMKEIKSNQSTILPASSSLHPSFETKVLFTSYHLTSPSSSALSSPDKLFNCFHRSLDFFQDPPVFSSNRVLCNSSSKSNF
ncbi:hypothetical protein AVEN_241381-1 [Araneus ventricosus]|uniref:Uncharacterized protein n=1 Tax=Araneus ventricosus TaxID=182803 RepID=A0A4Y2MAL6_ARAVE|nr:hypothetical protein AVEN_241381-1 [Araneus ventricosus]